MAVKILKVIKKGTKYQVYASSSNDLICFTEDSIVNNRIVKDKVFCDEEWDKIINDNELTFIFDKVLHYIDYKPRTTKEVINYLLDKNILEEDINEIIRRLEDINYLNDELYTKMYIDESIKNLKGPYLIIHHLEVLGISKSLINENIGSYTNQMQYENAYKVAKKYQQSKTKYQVYKQKELIYQKLIRSGYYHDIVTTVLSNLNYMED